MIPIQVDASDLERLGTELQNYPRRARPVFQIGVRAAADVVVREAKRTTAFRDRTGRLRRGITHVPDPADPLGRIVTVRGPAMRYAGFVEHGTSRMRARPYLRPAAQNTGREQVRAFELAIEGKLPE